MVSLDDRHGEDLAEERAQFMEDAGLNNEEEFYGHCTNNFNEPTFHQLHTLWLAALSLILLVILEVLAILIPALCHNNHCALSDLSTGLLLQVVFWSLVLIIGQYYRWQHRHLRQCGYLMFCDEVSVLKRAPLYIFSFGNAVLLLAIVVLHEYCPQDELCQLTVHFHPVNFVQAIITLQVLVCFPFVILYMVKIVKFNKQKLPPDIQQEDLHSSYSNINLPEAEIGYRSSDTTNEVIERQGDYIRYLKQHNANLGRKLLLLANELKSLKAV